MALLKRRPKVQLRAPSLLVPGESFEAIVIVDAERPVPVTAITVSFTGKEEAAAGSGDDQLTSTRRIVNMVGELSGPAQLDAGVRSYPFVFRLPKSAPPSFYARAFGSRLAECLYTYDVHIEIPWWPDRRASFLAKVGFADRPVPAGRPVLSSSSEAGPGHEGGYVELSLSTDVFGPDDEITGAIALGNRDKVRYRALEVALVSYCEREVRHERSTDETGRHSSPVQLPKGNESITFRRRLPEKVFPTIRSRHWRHVWGVEVTAAVLNGPDVKVQVPVEIVPSKAPRSRSRLAPPVVGRKRVEGIWQEVAQEHGLALEDDVLRGRAGHCEVTIERESTATGNRLVAELAFEDLRLGLSMRTRLLSPRQLAGRDEGQTKWFVDLLPVYEGIEVEAADGWLRLSQPGSGQDRTQLSEFVAAALKIAAEVPRARDVPIAAAHEPWRPKWQELANVLEGELRVADLSVAGRLGGCEVEVFHHWPRRGAAKTSLSARPPGALRQPNAKLAWAQLGTDAKELQSKGASLRTLDDRLLLELPLQLDASPLLPKLRALARAARALTAAGLSS